MAMIASSLGGRVIIALVSLLLVATTTTTTRVSAFVIHNNGGASSSRTSTSLNGNALIVQNKGGGHGELGFQLAKTLQTKYADKINSITILQDDACDDTKEPFNSYSTDIPNVRIVKAPLSAEDQSDLSTGEDIQSILGDDQKYDYVWDNASKKPEGFSMALPTVAKLDWNCKLYTYVSSAGMYQPTPSTTFPMDEDTTPIKESAGQHLMDEYCLSIGLPYVSFRPQYIYGPKANKNDYIDWYFDRITSKSGIVPIPGDGTQLVSLTNSEDVASLLASVLNNEEAAVKQRYFNCGTDQLISYNDVATLCSEVADKPPPLFEHYDISKGKQDKFPFRLENFYVAPSKAKSLLKWEGPKHTLKDDLSDWYYDSYKERGGLFR